MGMQIKGIDISHWQGSVDFGKVVEEANYIILKVSQMTSVDKKFETYYKQIASRIPVGVYIYVKAKSTVDAKREAQTAINALKGKNIPMGVWLDIEDNSLNCLSKGEFNAFIEAEAQLIKAAGYNVGIYCNLSWYNTKLDSQSLANRYPFWIARYPIVDTGVIKSSLSPEGKKGVKIWQYSSKGRVSGISGNVDMNVCFNLLNNIFGSQGASPSTYSDALPKLPARGYFIKGDKSEEVRKLQIFLNWSVNAGLVTDAACGAKTISAVIKFQEIYGLVADGKFGKASLKKAEELI